MAKKFECCICHRIIKDEYPNNPAPYRQSGQCCFQCNNKFVIPARLNQIRSLSQSQTKGGCN